MLNIPSLSLKILNRVSPNHFSPSLQMHLSITTSSPASLALAAASAFTTPFISRLPLPPILMACSTISGTSLGSFIFVIVFLNKKCYLEINLWFL